MESAWVIMLKLSMNLDLGYCLTFIVGESALIPGPID